MATPNSRFGRGDVDKPYRPETTANDPREVRIEPAWNVRDMTSQTTREWIQSIKDSILAFGYDQTEPITVRYDKKTGIKTLVDGECRLTACRELWDEGHEIFVPMIRTEGDEATLTLDALAKNAKNPLTQWENGVGYRRLRSYGKSVEEIAARVCKPVRYVTEAIALSNVSLEAKAMLSAGQVTPGAVLHAIKEHGPDAAAEELKAQIEAQPQPSQPAQASIPGTIKPVKPKPITRPKAESKTDLKNRTFLELADALCRLVLDPSVELNDLELAAKAYKKARGI